MVARLLWLPLLLLASCDGCNNVIVADGGGGAGAGPGGAAALTCEGVCQERFDRFGCNLDLCGEGCSPEFLALIEMLDCSDAFLRYINCTNEFGNSCNDGCAEPEGYEWGIDCQQKLQEWQFGGGGGAGGR